MAGTAHRAVATIWMRLMVLIPPCRYLRVQPQCRKPCADDDPCPARHLDNAGVACRPSHDPALFYTNFVRPESKNTTAAADRPAGVASRESYPSLMDAAALGPG